MRIHASHLELPLLLADLSKEEVDQSGGSFRGTAKTDVGGRREPVRDRQFRAHKVEVDMELGDRKTRDKFIPVRRGAGSEMDDLRFRRTSRDKCDEIVTKHKKCNYKLSSVFSDKASVSLFSSNVLYIFR